MADGKRGSEFGSDAGPAPSRFDDGQWGSETNADSIAIVAEPIRYPRSPLIALLVLAVVPTIGLLVLSRWADGEAEKYESSRDAVELLQNRLESGSALDGVEPVPEAGDADFDGVDDSVADALATGVLDYRRAPGAVAGDASADLLAQSVEPVLSFIGDRSCAAVSVDSVSVIASNPTLPVIPASNQKLLVATAALEVLGPDHTFTTSVAVPAAVDGVIDGDIYLIGGGDPLLTSDDYPIEDDRLPVFNATSIDPLVQALVDAGVTRIRGKVIGDGSRYDDEFVVTEWDEGIGFNDAGPYDALLANDARVRGRSGRQDDPNEGAAREFARLLGNAGIRVDNGWGSGTASTLVPVLATVESVPLPGVLAEMLVNSDNNTAEMLLKEIGFAASGQGTRAAGLDAMVDTLTALGVPMDGVSPVDGSGLSNDNRVTCAAVLAIVQLNAGGPIDEAMPIASFSGTLANEFVDSVMSFRLRAKTGTLNNDPIEEDPPAVKALAGYVDPVPGTDIGTIEFVVIANTPNVTDENVYQPLWKALGERFATYPAGPRDDSLGPR